MLNDQELLDANRRFYDLLWSGARLVEPEQFNTWPLVRSLLSDCGRRLEVAPGLRPRLPIEGTQFVDISAPALMKLRERGAQVVLSQIRSLPFADGAFDLVCALDVIEHVDDDHRRPVGAIAGHQTGRDSRDLGALAPLALDRFRRFRRPQAALRTVGPDRQAGAAPAGRGAQRSIRNAAALDAARRHRHVVAANIIANKLYGGTTSCSCRSDCGSRRH